MGLQGYNGTFRALRLMRVSALCIRLVKYQVLARISVQIHACSSYRSIWRRGYQNPGLHMHA